MQSTVRFVCAVIPSHPFAACAILLGLSSLPLPMCAQIRSPGQPTTGPGGSMYPYTKTIQSGPFSSKPGVSSPALAYYIFQPTGGLTPASLPVVLFLHGYLLNQEPTTGDSPQNYIYWIRHIVCKGYTVVFPLYDQGVGPTAFATDIISAWETALKRLGSGGFIPPQSDAEGLETAFVGHSLGAVEALTVAQTIAKGGVPLVTPRAIAAFTPGLGQTNLPIDFHQLDPNTKLILVDADEDTAADLATAQGIWSSVSEALPLSNRDFLEVVSDSHGTPAQLGDHWFPLTNGLNDTAAVDDRDYNVTWKLSVGLLNCVFAGTDCSYVLTHGGDLEVDMGLWSDGTAVHPLQENP